jgi:hypothetical protein
MVSLRRLVSWNVVPLTSSDIFIHMETELYETERGDANKPITKTWTLHFWEVNCHGRSSRCL